MGNLSGSGYEIRSWLHSSPTGAGTLLFSSDDAFRGAVLDEDDLFFVGGDGTDLFRLSLAGGAPELVYDGAELVNFLTMGDDGQVYFADTSGASGTDTLFAVVPEPGTAALLLAGFALIARRHRQR